jgi:hypothetical protein
VQPLSKDQAFWIFWKFITKPEVALRKLWEFSANEIAFDTFKELVIESIWGTNLSSQEAYVDTGFDSATAGPTETNSNKLAKARQEASLMRSCIGLLANRENPSRNISDLRILLA